MEDEFDIINNGGNPIHPSLKLLEDGMLDSTVQTPMGRTAASGSGDMYGYNIGLGASEYDEQLSPMSHIDFEDFTSSLEDYRSKTQPDIHKVGAGIARVGAKVVTEIAKMPGVIGGALMAPFVEEGQGYEMAFNNAWIRSIDEGAKHINEELLPVYVKKAIKDGNLWANISSIDFWATEGADGIGFLASMLAPGAALKAVGAGDKLFKGIRGVEKALGLGNKLDDSANILKSIRFTPKTFELGAQTVANTLIEAAAEAKGAGDAYIQRIQADLKAGKITQEEVDRNKAELMRNVFVSNGAILLGPNAVMSKMLWGSKALGKAAGDVMEKGAVGEATKRTLRQHLGKFGKETTIGAAREGLFEEGMQSTVEGYFTDQAVEGNTGSWFDAQKGLVSNLVEEYTNTMSTTDGQKAAFLGAFLGGGMSGVHGVKSGMAEDKRTESLISKLKDLESFHRVFTDDVINEDGTVDKTRVLQKMEALSTSEQLGEILNNALETGDNKTLEEIRTFASGELIKNYIISDEVGIDALNQYLDQSTVVEGISKKEKKGLQAIIEPIKKRALQLQKDSELFDEFKDSFMTIDAENATKADIVNYLDTKKSLYLTKKNFEYYVNDKLGQKEKSRSEFMDGLGFNRTIVEGKYTDFAVEDLAKKEGKTNIALQTLNEEIDELSKQSKDLHKDINNFWNPENSKEELTGFKKMREALEKAEEEENEINLLKKEIDEAATIDEVNAVGKGKSISNDALQSYKDSRIAILKAEAAKKKETTITKQEVTSEETTLEREVTSDKQTEILNEQIPDSQVGDMVVMTAELLALTDQPNLKEVIGQDAAVVAQEGSVVTYLLTESGTELKVDQKKIVVPEVVPGVFDDEATEGADQHDDLADNIGKSISNKPTGNANGSKLISTNEKTGEIFDFVDPDYVEAERQPVDKRGKRVGFKVGKKIESVGIKLPKAAQDIFNTLLKDPSLTNLTKVQLKRLGKYYRQTQEIQALLINKAVDIYNKEGVTDRNIKFLIEFLPMDGMLTKTVGAPMFTKPLFVKEFHIDKKGKAFVDSESTFNAGSRILRTNILNALKNGSNIENLESTIEGQYGGTIKVAPKVNGLIPENNIAGLQFLSNLTPIRLMTYIQNNIGFVNKNGQIELKDGETFTMNTLKEKAKGEIYLLIPSANGNKVPLKLNIKRLEGAKVDLLADIVALRFQEKDVKNSTSMAEITDTALLQNIKDTFSEELKIIGKTFNDTTLKDIVNFMIYDNKVENSKSRVRFRGAGVKGNTVFIYGNPKSNGKAELTSKEFDKEHFKTWLINNKRHNITLKANDRNQASIFNSIEYLNYLVTNGILNTNAVVGKDANGRPNPTFQGRTDIYVASNIKGVSGTKTSIIKDKTPKKTAPGNNKAKAEEIYRKMFTEGLSITDLSVEEQTLLDDPNLVPIKIREEIQKEVENKSKKIRNSQKNFVSSHEVENTMDAEEVKSKKEANTVTDSVEITDADLKTIIKDLMTKKLLKGGSVLFKTISNPKLSNQAKVDKMKETLGENTMVEVLKKCKG